MAVSPVAMRYAEALFASAKAGDEVQPTLQHLALLRRLMQEQPLLREFFLNPDVDPDDKVALLDKVTRKSWTELVRAFMRMLTAVYRAELLVEIAEAFESLVDKDERRVHAVVRSARKLPTETVKRLKTVLEKREGKTVLLSEETDPSLLGGLQVFIENRVIDGSIRRQLTELRSQLRGVSVA